MRDRKAVEEFMKKLFGDDDENEIDDTERGSRAEGAREVVEPSSCLKRPVLQK